MSIRAMPPFRRRISQRPARARSCHRGCVERWSITSPRNNPLGARSLYLGDTLYRIHGTHQPSTIGSFVSSGCIRLTNEDITDLYSRVKVGTRGGAVR